MDRNGVISADEIFRTVLPSGIVLLVRENHATPSVSVRGLIKAGAMYDTDDTAGLANFVAAGLERGTKNRTYAMLNKELDSLGATLGVSASDETASFYVRCLTEDFDRLLGILADVLLQPVFPRNEMEKVRGEILTGLRESRHDTQWVADNEFHQVTYPAGHPYHRPTEGTEDTVARISRQQLVRFHRTFYRPDSTILAVVGDTTPAEAEQKIAAAFETWQAQDKPHPFAIEDVRGKTKPQQKSVHVPGTSQADIVLGFPGLARTNPDFHAANMVNMILGVIGLFGRLGDNVRDEQGLAYYVMSELHASIGAGPWLVRAGVNPVNVERAISSIRRELERIRQEPVSSDELTAAQDFLTGSLALRLERNDGVASHLVAMELYGLGMDYLERYDGIIRSLTIDMLLAAAQKYIGMERIVTVVAGPV